MSQTLKWALCYQADLDERGPAGLVGQRAGDRRFLTGANPPRLGEAPEKPEVNSPLQSCRTQLW